MALTFYGPSATKAQTLQDLYKELTVNKEGDFEIDFPTVGSGAPQNQIDEAYEAARVSLLTLFRNGLRSFNARDGKSIVREYYPTPGLPAPFFDEVDLAQALTYANTMLNPRDPYFAMAVSDGEVGAIRILGDVINMINRYGDARAAFVLLRMYVRPVRGEGENSQERPVTALPFDERKNTLIRRRNSMLAVGFRADNNVLVPEVMKKWPGEETEKLLTGVFNSYDQNGIRLNLSELQRHRWFFVLLNNMNAVKGEMSPEMRNGLTALSVDFNSAQKPEEMAIKIDGFVDMINPRPAEGAEGTAGAQGAQTAEAGQQPVPQE